MAGFGLGNYINPAFGGFIDQRRNALAGLGAGLLSGRPGTGVQEGIQADTAFAVMQKAEDERAKNINQTQQWLQANYPQYATLPAAEGWQAAMADMSAKRNAGSGAEDPASIREWQTFSAMTPAEQSQYLLMKRSVPYLDVGTGYVQPNPVSPGTPNGPAIVKDNFTPAADEAAGKVIGGTNAERDLQAPIEATKNERLDAQTDNVIGTVDKALSQVNGWSSGLGGRIGGDWNVSNYDLRKTLETIKANLGFAELQAMRDASPTGGALGQVAVQELEALQSTLASLDSYQSPEQLMANLNLVKELLERQKYYRSQTSKAKYGSAPTQTTTGVQWSYDP